jgi:hypothetical protein
MAARLTKGQLDCGVCFHADPFRQKTRRAPDEARIQEATDGNNARRRSDLRQTKRLERWARHYEKQAVRYTMSIELLRQRK